MGKPFRLVDQLREFLLQVMVRILIGQPGDLEEVQALVQDITIWSKGLLSAPLDFVPWSLAARAGKARARVAARLREWIAKSRADKAGGSLLAALVHAKDEEGGGSLSEEAIVDNLFTLLFAGSDTTASTLSSAFLALSQDPALQAQLRAACSGTGSVNADEQLDAFLSEVLRRYPPAPFAVRLVTGETLQVGDFTVPKGWLLVYGFAGTLAADAEVYPEPEEFRPQRWLLCPSPRGALAEGAFGGGPRMCPGRFLAAQVARSLVRAVLSQEGFSWELTTNQDLSQRYTPGFFPVDGLQVSVQ